MISTSDSGKAEECGKVLPDCRVAWTRERGASSVVGGISTVGFRVVERAAGEGVKGDFWGTSGASRECSREYIVAEVVRGRRRDLVREGSFGTGVGDAAEVECRQSCPRYFDRAGLERLFRGRDGVMVCGAWGGFRRWR